jgi:hypothetical protein
LTFEKRFGRPGQASADYHVQLRLDLAERPRDVSGLVFDAWQLPTELGQPPVGLGVDLDAVFRE